jgi:branched-chain amino acid transport system permease protein
MSTVILITITGLGLGAMYFLVASGLSLIYGLMGVLNFAHGAFITVGAYASWWTSAHVFDGVHSVLLRFLLGALVGLLVGVALAFVRDRLAHTNETEEILDLATGTERLS